MAFGALNPSRSTARERSAIELQADPRRFAEVKLKCVIAENEGMWNIVEHCKESMPFLSAGLDLNLHLKFMSGQ